MSKRKGKVIHCCLQLLLVSVYLVGCVVASANENGTVRGKIKITTGEGYFPFIDENFVEGGWSRAIINRVFSLMNLDVEVVILPWDRALLWTQEGKMLGAFPYVFSQERDSSFLYSMPINTVPIRLYGSPHGPFQTLNDIQGRRLCLPHGYSISHAVKDIIEQYSLSLNRAKNGKGCVGQVMRGWSDVGLTNGYVAADKLDKGDEQNEPIHIFSEELSSEPLYFLISKTYPDAQQWMNEFNYALEQLEKSGQKQKIDQYYLQVLAHP